MKTSAALVSLVFTLASVGIVAAWRDMGHMLVGEIAKLKLNPVDNQKIENVLKQFDGMYPGTGHLGAAGIWPDSIKCDIRETDCEGLIRVDRFTILNSFHVTGKINKIQGYTPDPPGAQLFRPYEGSGTVFFLEQLMKSLGNDRSGSSDPTVEDSYGTLWSWNLAIRYATHFLGDTTMPLHNSEGYHTFYPDGDWTGSALRMDTYREGYPVVTFHEYWDAAGGKLIDSWPETPPSHVTEVAQAFVDEFPRETLVAEGFPMLEFPNPNFKAVHEYVYQFAAPTYNEMDLNVDDYHYKSFEPTPEYEVNCYNLSKKLLTYGGYLLTDALTHMVKQMPPFHDMDKCTAVYDTETHFIKRFRD